MRLFTVIVFSFAASTVAANFSYGLEGEPTVLSIDQLNSGRLPAGTEIGDYVRVSGTPDVGENLRRVGVPKSRIAIVSRYETAYFYFRLEETGDNLLIQTTQGLPKDLQSSGERVFRGKLETVGTVIFHDTTQRGLKNNRALAPLGSLAGLEEEQTDVGYVARQHATPFDPHFSARLQLSRSQALADLLKCYIDKAHRQAEGRSRHCAPSSGSPSGARTSGRRWWPGLPPS
jgi:hypothetical protein